MAKAKKDSFQEDKTKEELITFLEKNLETVEKRFAKLQNVIKLLLIYMLFQKINNLIKINNRITTF